MKRFLIVFIGMCLYLLLAMEVALRVFNKVTDPMIEQVVGGVLLYKPGQQGKWLRGSNAEIKSEFKVNKDGWNSEREYDYVTGKKYIAIIGDSYIEGLHVPPDSSIGRKIESLCPDVVVHEYGKSGWASEDYKGAFEKYCNEKYDKVFIVMTNEDLFDTSKSFGKIALKADDNNFVRNLYYTSAVLRYANIQLGFWENLHAILRFRETNGHAFNDVANNSNQTDNQKMDRRKYFDDFPSNVFFLYENDKLVPYYQHYLGLRGIEIRHSTNKTGFGFDPHWNNQARWDVARAIMDKLK
ncbi:MAG TPA: hypothetical protein VF421_07785 [Niabella sp.]